MGDRTTAMAQRAKRAMLRRQHRACDLQIAPSAYLGPGFRLVTFGAARLVIGGNVRFRHNCVIELEHGSTVEIGAGTVFTYNTVVQATIAVRIGERCLFAAGSSVVDSKHTFRDTDGADAHRRLEARPLTIGDGVWVSSKATVAADVGTRSVIAANAAVVRPIPAWTLAGGTPARVIDEIAPQSALV